MVAVAKQIVMGGLEDPQEVEERLKAHRVWRAQLWGALRVFVAGYSVGTGLGQKGYNACAAELDRIWGPEGRPVSASQLRAALEDSERNNFRLEWIDWFAAMDSDIAAIMAHRARGPKSDKEELEDLRAEVRETYPKHSEQVIRRARAR